MRSLCKMDDKQYIQLKKKMLTMQYMSTLSKIVSNIMEYDGCEDCPFPKSERKSLTDLFKRSSVVQHTVFKVSLERARSIPVSFARSV